MAPGLNRIFKLDSCRDLYVGRDTGSTLHFCAEHFIAAAKKAIEERGIFRVALSGGHTPKQIFASFLQEPFKSAIDWRKVELFWSDERSVPPTSEDSNYHMAMQAAFSHLPIPATQIHRMVGEVDIEKGALAYDELLRKYLPLDLVLLGMGDDGHTASLFPHTAGLRENTRLVIANQVPQKNTWRMTFTYKAIHSSRSVVFYVLGPQKLERLKEVWFGPKDPERLPSQKVGTPNCKSLWITDQAEVLSWLPKKARI